MILAANRSDCGPTAWPVICSGDMKPGVPTIPASGWSASTAAMRATPNWVGSFMGRRRAQG